MPLLFGQRIPLQNLNGMTRVKRVIKQDVVYLIACKVLGYWRR